MADLAIEMLKQLRAEIAEKDAEIERLRYEIETLKEALTLMEGEDWPPAECARDLPFKGGE